MAKTRSPRERRDKAAGNVESLGTVTQATDAMERFKSLAKRLLGVSREQLQEAERRYQKARGGRRPRRRAG